jgi:hypothetical protein
MLSVPDTSGVNPNDLEWYFDPLIKAEHEIAYHDHYRYRLELGLYGSTLPYIQGSVRDDVIQTVFSEARTFMDHDRKLRTHLYRMGRLLPNTLENGESDDDFHKFMEWYRSQYDEFHDIRQENYDAVHHAADSALEPPTRTDTVH